MHSSHRSHAGLDWLRAGDHVCQFYASAEDLAEVLIPFFKAGLERNESCLWIAGNLYGVERASSDMRAAVADFDQRATVGQIQIVDQGEWHAKYGALSVAGRVQSFLSWKDGALASGYTGIRSGGDLSSLHEGNLDAFLDYERAVDNAFQHQPIVALCCYCLTKCSGKCLLDAVACHGFGLAKRRGRWMPVGVWHRERPSPRAEYGPPASRWGHETELIDLIEELLAIYVLAYPGRITLDGAQHIALPASSAAKLRPALRELTANAEKFGALANPQGVLSVKWHLSVNGSRRLSVTWTERGMSGLTFPDRIGRGTQVLAGAVENCVRVFEPTGMRCAFELSL